MSRVHIRDALAWIFRPRRLPPCQVTIIIVGKDEDMPVSQDVQDFCGQLGPRVQAKVDAAVTAALAEAASTVQAAQDKAVADALSQVQQDHADEVQALKAALDAATGPAPGAG